MHRTCSCTGNWRGENENTVTEQSRDKLPRLRLTPRLLAATEVIRQKHDSNRNITHMTCRLEFGRIE